MKSVVLRLEIIESSDSIDHDDNYCRGELSGRASRAIGIFDAIDAFTTALAATYESTRS